MTSQEEEPEPANDLLCPGCGEPLEPFESYWTDGENVPCNNCDLDSTVTVFESGACSVSPPEGVERIISERDEARAAFLLLWDALDQSARSGLEPQYERWAKSYRDEGHARR